MLDYFYLAIIGLIIFAIIVPTEPNPNYKIMKNTGMNKISYLLVVIGVVVLIFAKILAYIPIEAIF
jgi:magnesium-transporting ATPase (P-type)